MPSCSHPSSALIGSLSFEAVEAGNSLGQQPRTYQPCPPCVRVHEHVPSTRAFVSQHLCIYQGDGLTVGRDEGESVSQSIRMFRRFAMEPASARRAYHGARSRAGYRKIHLTVFDVPTSALALSEYWRPSHVQLNHDIATPFVRPCAFCLRPPAERRARQVLAIAAPCAHPSHRQRPPHLSQNHRYHSVPPERARLLRLP
ncbi:hypothetical protein KC320_g97 [Hortaea werneckii]|nr:hypothetical protein KC320_g97 [Hortaea werneckii]